MRKSPQRMSTKTIKIRMKCRRIMISSRRVFLNLFFEEIPDFEGDVFFPELGPEWTGTVDEVHEENGITYRYLTITSQTADLQ